MNRRARQLSLRTCILVLLSLVLASAVSVTAFWLTADPIAGQTTPTLRVMKTGLGSGTVASSMPGITCGIDCNETYGSGMSVTLRANQDPGSTFARWNGDCSGTTPVCTVTMSADLAVRAAFSLTPAIAPIIAGLDTDINRTTAFTPTVISAYLANPANSNVNSAARFIEALPRDFKQNWILMSRSESLQTGTAESPRILLPSADAKYVFTVGMATHTSYPGSHPNAIEYMQWDAAQKNFRFHEIVLAPIPSMGTTITVGLPDGTFTTTLSIPPRPRGISIDDAKCSKCHSTRNVLSLDRSVFPPVTGSFTGTNGIPPGSVQVKNKPNWDTYDSWGGMLPFNRDRIYQGSVEAAAFRRIFNPWTWRTNDPVRQIIEQLELQPPDQFLPDGNLDVTRSIPREDVITRTIGGINDGHVNFAFDPPTPVLLEPALAVTLPVVRTNYLFNGVPGTGAETVVKRDGRFVTLRHTTNLAGNDEGRGVQFFDLLGGADGNLNQLRIADELINHRFATGSVPIDVRPIVLAIIQGALPGSSSRCLNINAATNTVVSAVSTPLTVNLGFFNTRHGIMGINDLVTDTTRRAQSLPHRKADIQKLNLDRTGDPYLLLSAPRDGLIQQYGGATSVGTDPTLSGIDIIRQEVFRRSTIEFAGDSAGVMRGIYVDRENYVNGVFNTELIALLRYFLEPWVCRSISGQWGCGAGHEPIPLRMCSMTLILT